MKPKISALPYNLAFKLCEAKSLLTCYFIIYNLYYCIALDCHRSGSSCGKEGTNRGKKTVPAINNLHYTIGMHGAVQESNETISGSIHGPLVA